MQSKYYPNVSLLVILVRTERAYFRDLGMFKNYNNSNDRDITTFHRRQTRIVLSDELNIGWDDGHTLAISRIMYKDDILYHGGDVFKMQMTIYEFTVMVYSKNAI